MWGRFLLSLNFLNLQDSDWSNYQWQLRIQFTCEMMVNTLGGYLDNWSLEYLLATNHSLQTETQRTNCFLCGRVCKFRWSQCDRRRATTYSIHMPWKVPTGETAEGSLMVMLAVYHLKASSSLSAWSPLPQHLFAPYASTGIPRWKLWASSNGQLFSAFLLILLFFLY